MTQVPIPAAIRATCRQKPSRRSAAPAAARGRHAPAPRSAARRWPASQQVAPLPPPIEVKPAPGAGSETEAAAAAVR